MYKVLLVDDHKVFIIELKRLKVWGENSGFEVAGSAENGKQALEMLKTSHYDMVITDIRMPVLDGLQLLRKTAEEHLCPCVVLISEYSEFRYAREGIVLGVFDYLVKPADESSILQMLTRAGRFLDSRQEDDVPSGSEIDWAYPAEEEKRIIAGIQNRTYDAVDIFKRASEELYAALPDNLTRADILVRKLYRTVMKASFDYFSWLRLYIDFDFFSMVNYNQNDNSEVCIALYCHKIYYLRNIIRKYFPEFNGTIKDICVYILEHPEGNLKLKTLADRFYINHTYLSNSFAAKTGLYFNNYVTMVKMARAEYLFSKTSMKTYEVSYQLGYHDVPYFSKLFRRYFGKSPAEFRNTKGAQ